MIKSILNPGPFTKSIDLSLLILRLAGGALMLTHGTGKFFKLFGDGPIQFADPIGIGATASLALAVFSEVFCAVFLVVGFATRLSAISLLITMLVATFIVHANDAFGKQELPLIYAAIYLAIAIAGAGKYSVDKVSYERISPSSNVEH